MSDVDSNAVHHPMSIGTATCFVQRNGRARNALRKGAEKKRCILAIANVMLVPAQEQPQSVQRPTSNVSPQSA